MNENNSFFLRNRTSIIIILVVVFVLAGILLWVATLKNGIPGMGEQQTLTQEQIQAIINDKPTGPSPLTKTETTAIVNDRPKGTTTVLTAEQESQILNDHPR